MGTVKVTNIEPIADNGTVTLGGSGDTITLGSGATVTGTGLVGITEADQFRLTTSITTPSGILSSNLERVDNTTFQKIGTGMSLSSGIFSFPTKGLYLVRYTIFGDAVSNDNIQVDLEATQDNFSTYETIALAVESGDAGTGNNNFGIEAFVNVNDVSNVKVRFRAGSFATGSRIIGNTSINYTAFTFIRLGDSQ